MFLETSLLQKAKSRRDAGGTRSYSLRQTATPSRRGTMTGKSSGEE